MSLNTLYKNESIVVEVMIASSIYYVHIILWLDNSSCTLLQQYINAAQTFQCIMDQELQGLPFTYDYIDDLLVASATKEDHLEHLREVCCRLAANGIVINPNKCVLGAESVEFLGHRVGRRGIRPLEEKVDVI